MGSSRPERHKAERSGRLVSDARCSGTLPHHVLPPGQAANVSVWGGGGRTRFLLALVI